MCAGGDAGVPMGIHGGTKDEVEILYDKGYERFANREGIESK